MARACRTEKNTIPSRYKWLQYEREKKKLQNKVLSPAQYEAEIRKICEKLKI